MPTTPQRARTLLREYKAKVVSTIPFVIKLKIATGETKQDCIAGMDTGSKTIGCAVISNSAVIYQSEVQLRQDIKRKMDQRRNYRRTRRSRKTRYRKCRFNRKLDRTLNPTIQSKLDSHLKEKKFVGTILPINSWKVELAKFDIHKIVNPEVKGKEYQNGALKDFYNVKSYILNRDGYKCTKCKSKNVKLHIHHIQFKSNGGGNSPKNLITLCEDCHKSLHKGEFEIKASKKNRTKHATEVSVIASQIKKHFGKFVETFGYETKFKREQVLNLSKTHYNDAVAICCEDGEIVTFSNEIILKKSVPKGDYQQYKGRHSQIKIPTGKLFGLKKFDLIQTSKGVGFVKGKRSNGYFAIMDINGETINPSVNIKKDCTRLSARKTIIQNRAISSQP